MLVPRFDICFKPGYDTVEGCAGNKESLETGVIKQFKILFRNNTATDNGNITSPLLFQQLGDAGNKYRWAPDRQLNPTTSTSS
jgi:hypothetical protein